jgi:2-methylcitrate dehydratase PrpD
VTRLLEIASWASGLRLEDVPPSVRERAELQRASMLGAARAGARAEGVRRLRVATRRWGAKGPCSVIGERFKLEPAAAVYANAAASIAHDWDDYLYMGHTGHSAVWTSRALAESSGAEPGQVLTAQIAANEISGRLGAALFLGPHNGQFWSSIHCAGAAAAAGMLAGLEREQLAHAMAIALYQPPYGLWPGFMGPDTKLLTAAEPAAQGTRAAELAAEGFTGPLDVLESPRGLLAHFAFAARPSMLGALGQTWLTDTLAFKPLPGCAYLQSSLEALLRLREEHGFEAGEIAELDVEGGWLTTGMEALAAGESLTAVRVNFSVALSAAVALTAGRLTHEELTPAWLHEHKAQLHELAGRTRLRHDWALTAETIKGTADALPLRAALSDVPGRRLMTVPRRMRETGMDELGVGLAELRELVGSPDARAAIGGLFSGRERRGAGKGLAALDTSRLRLTFPARVRVRLRSGRTLEAEGREPGSCGRPIPEQRDVVTARWRAAGGRGDPLSEALP